MNVFHAIWLCKFARYWTLKHESVDRTGCIYTDNLMTDTNSMWIGQQPTYEQVSLYQIEGSSHYLTVNAFHSVLSFIKLKNVINMCFGKECTACLGLGSSSKSENSGISQIIRIVQPANLQFHFCLPTIHWAWGKKYLLRPAEYKDFRDLPRQFWAKHPRQPKSNRLRNVEASALDVNCL